MKTITASWFVIAMAACSSLGAQSGPGSAGKPVDPPTPATDVLVELAAVTLADDCGGTLRGPPPPVQVASAESPRRAIARPADEAPAAASCAQGADCSSRRRACEQTSMQLAIRASGQPATIAVKKVELLDDKGTVLGELAATGAMRWTHDKYEAWDQQLAASQSVSASYALAAPPYDKMGGRWAAHDKQFQLRVTVVVAGKERTIEKKALAPTMLEPAVPT
jgi:hypothetical protein